MMRTLAAFWIVGIEVEIQLQYINTRFAEQAKLPALDVLLDECIQLTGGNFARGGHAWKLEKRICRRDVRVES